MKVYLVLVVVPIAALNAFWRYETVSHRPSLQALDAGLEVDGPLRRRHVGTHAGVETRIEGLSVICGPSFRRPHGQCPLDRAGDGEFVRASIVAEPTIAGGIGVIKSLRLADGTSYSVSGQELQDDWESSLNKMELGVTALLAVAALLLGWVFFFQRYKTPVHVEPVVARRTRVR